MTNPSWLLYFGRRVGMSKTEIMHTTIGELFDMIACYDIAHGYADPKPKPMSYDEAISLR